MKRFIIPALMMAVVCCFSFIGCVQKQPYTVATTPSMTGDIGTYKFVASAVTTSTIDTQRYDTSTSMVITGYGADKVSPYDKIIIIIANYKRKTGTYSIAQGQAHAYYFHGGIMAKALGGIVAINNVTTTETSGYFSFNTEDGIAITNGKYVANNP